MKLKFFASRLNCGGIIWAILSFAAAATSCIGFYLPYWIQGKFRNSDIDVSFGTFRRCNYQHLTNDGKLVLVSECGRYTTFSAIPSLWWQIATIVVGTGCCVALFVAFLTLFAICLSDIFSKSSAKVTGALQGVAGLLIGGGCALYPIGWTNDEVHSICGHDARPYYLGSCHLGWAFYASAIGGALTIVASFMSCGAIRYSSKMRNRMNYRDLYDTQSTY